MSRKIGVLFLIVSGIPLGYILGVFTTKFNGYMLAEDMNLSANQEVLEILKYTPAEKATTIFCTILFILLVSFSIALHRKRGFTKN